MRFIVDCLHALLCERTEVLNGLAALTIGLAMNHAAWAEDFAERLAVGEDFMSPG
jgi:hypothetical protein